MKYLWMARVHFNIFLDIDIFCKHVRPWVDKKYVKKKERERHLPGYDSRHCWSLQIAMKVDKVCSFQPALWPLQLMKATVPAESYKLYPLSSRSADSSNVY